MLVVKSKNLGLAGLVLAGGLTLFNILGCGKDRPLIELPNGYSTTGIVANSSAHKGSDNVYSNEDSLEEKSRVVGEITYLGFGKNEDVSLSINNINQNAMTSGLISGSARNNMTIYDNMGIIIKIKTGREEYIFSLKTQENMLPPSIILEKYKEGDRVSIPTIRKYEFAYKDSLEGYRILNGMDYIYLHEIQDSN